MGGRVAVGLALLVWAGLALGATHPGWVWPALLAGAVLAPCAGARHDLRGTLALTLVALLVALARGGASRTLIEHQALAIGHADPNGEPTLWFEARVVDHPWREADAPSAVVRTLQDEPGLPRGTRLRLWLPAGCNAEWGDTLQVLARLETPGALRVPGGFTALEAARADGVAASGRAHLARVRVARGLAAWPRATIARWRRALEASYAAVLSADARELVTPLVTGDRSAVSPALGGDLQGAGLTHLLALSGLHVVWLASVARALVAVVGAGLGGRAIAGALCALLYAGIAGPLPSLMRAVATELVAALARLTGRALDPVQALALSVLALLAWAPGWHGDLGFQLSCTATLGLLTIGSGLGALTRALPIGPARAAVPLRALIGALLPTMAAQIMSLPLLLARFHALPWTTLLANLLAVPISGLMLAAAWLGALLDALAPGSGHLPLRACEPLAWALRAVASGTARAPLALWPCGHEQALVWLAALGAAALAWALSGSRTVDERQRVVPPARVAAAAVGVVAVVLALMLAATAPTMTPPPGRWWMVVLDVGQGDAIALAFGDQWWLVDSGPRSEHADAGRRAVLPFLRWAAVRRLDVLALTHDDSDHTGGAPAVRAGIPVTRVIAPVLLPNVRGPAGRFHANTVAAGETLWREPPVHVLWPPRGFDTRADNDAGLVLEVGEGAARVWLTADVDSNVEARLAAEQHATPGLAVLKVSHHGSGSSSGARFLATLQPGLAIISCGRHNPFGHPSPGALARLDGVGATVRRTDREGTLWIECSRDGATVLDWRDGALERRADPDGRTLALAWPASVAAASGEVARGRGDAPRAR